MIAEQLAALFSQIAEIECWDMEDGACIDGVQSVISQAGFGFYTIAGIITFFSLVFAALPKYTFKWSIFNDIILRRLIFLLGLALSVYTLLTAWVTALSLCAMRDDGDVAVEVFSSMASTAYYIAMAIYPLTFILVAFVFDKFLHRRKLMSIFRSNNKIFGLI
jgi:hypothetical protein